MIGSDRRELRALVADAVAQGARQHAACEMVGVAARTLQRWQHPATAEDGRRGPTTGPRHTLAPQEREQIMAIAARSEFCNVSPHQIVPRLADRGDYVASESSCWHISYPSVDVRITGGAVANLDAVLSARYGNDTAKGACCTNPSLFQSGNESERRSANLSL